MVSTQLNMSCNSCSFDRLKSNFPPDSPALVHSILLDKVAPIFVGWFDHYDNQQNGASEVTSLVPWTVMQQRQPSAEWPVILHESFRASELERCFSQFQSQGITFRVKSKYAWLASQLTHKKVASNRLCLASKQLNKLKWTCLIITTNNPGQHSCVHLSFTVTKSLSPSSVVFPLSSVAFIVVHLDQVLMEWMGKEVRIAPEISERWAVCLSYIC